MERWQGIAYNARWLGVRFNDAKPKLYAVPLCGGFFCFTVLYRFMYNQIPAGLFSVEEKCSSIKCYLYKLKMGALKLTYYETKNPLKVVYSKTLEEQKSVQRFLSGDPTQPNYITRLRYHQMFIKKWAQEVKQRSPKGADLRSWNY